MLSVLIPVMSRDLGLLDSIAALVPAVADGFVRDLVLAAEAGNDIAAKAAEEAGCALLIASGSRVDRVMAAAGQAKCAFVFVLDAGMVPSGAWAQEAEAFLAARPDAAAVLTLAPAPGEIALRPWLRNLAVSAGLRPHPRHGLLIARRNLPGGGRAVRLSSPILDRRRPAL